MKFLSAFNDSNFRRFWFAQLISQFGDRINQMALIGLVASRYPGSTMGLAKAISTTILPVFIVGPLAGAFIDRWPRKQTMFICDVVRGLIVLCIALFLIDLDSILPIYAAIFLMFCLSRFHVPSKMSLVKDITHSDDLHEANTLISMTGMIAFVAGVLIGSTIVEHMGAKVGFLWDAVTFFVSAALVLRIVVKDHSEDGPVHVREHGHTFIDEIKEGLHYIRTHPDIRFMINMMCAMFAVAGCLYIVLVVFIQMSFNSVVKDLGFLAIPTGAGLFTGSVLYGQLGKNYDRYKTILVSLMTGGVMVIVFAVLVQSSHSRLVAMGLATVLGMTLGPIIIAGTTVIHEVSDPKMQGRVFAALEIIGHAVFLLAMFISAVLADITGPFWIVLVSGLLLVLVGLSGFARIPRSVVKG